jgi:hypothetical protein
MTFGWSLNTTVAPVAFMVAAVPTRGGVTQTILMLVVVLCLGWLLADLAIVFVGPQLDRMPLALVHVAAVAGALGYVSVKQPKLALMRSVGGLLALLTVYGGPMAATDVYGPYSTTCYIALAVAVGWAATQLFWPATAATLFRARAAAQIDLCLSALRGLAPGCDHAERRRHVARILQRYTGQLASMAGLHGQAEHEPVELDLDGSRRAALLALTQDLFDASLATRGDVTWAGEPEPGPSRRGLASLREALVREDEALFASVQSAADTLRGRATVIGTAAAPGAALAEAQRTVLDCLDTLRDDAGDATFLEQLDTRRRVVTRQLALEAWLADWATAGAGHLAPAEP